jgi:hypothetical protein
VCAVASVTALLGWSSLATFAVPASASGSLSSTVIQTCTGKQVTRPTTFTISCGDGNSYLTKLRWRSWSAGSAKATGIYTVNNCDPYCAAGKFVSSRATIVLSGKKVVKTRRFFTSLRVGYVSGPRFKPFNFALLI